MNQKTIDKLKNNPFYKPTPGQLGPDEPQGDNIRTFGVAPKVFTTPPKQHVEPQTVIHAPPRPVPTPEKPVKPKRQRKSRSRK